MPETGIILARRSFLIGAAAAIITAPAIVRVDSLMKRPPRPSGGRVPTIRIGDHIQMGNYVLGVVTAIITPGGLCAVRVNGGGDVFVDFALAISERPWST